MLATGPTGASPPDLAGPRGPVCERFVLAVDQSGSTRDIAYPPAAALGELCAWLRSHLRSDEQLEIVEFGAVAAGRLPYHYVCWLLVR